MEIVEGLQACIERNAIGQHRDKRYKLSSNSEDILEIA
jgi:hypothetical protein